MTCHDCISVFELLMSGSEQIVLLVFLFGAKRAKGQFAWSLYLPVLFHFCCCISLLIIALVANYQSIGYEIVYGLSVASFYYILLKNLFKNSSSDIIAAT